MCFNACQLFQLVHWRIIYLHCYVICHIGKTLMIWSIFFNPSIETHKSIHLSIIPASSGACHLLRVNGERPRRLLKPTSMTLCLLGLCCSQGRPDELRQLGERILLVGGKGLMMHHHFDCNSLCFPLKRDRLLKTHNITNNMKYKIII